jgi:hypothetical protein
MKILCPISRDEQLEVYRSIKNFEDINLLSVFRNMFYGISEKYSEIYYFRFLSTLLYYVLKNFHNLSDNRLNVPTSELFDKCGMFQFDNVRYSVYKEFTKIFPFFRMIERGNSYTGRVSVVEVNDYLLHYLVDALPEAYIAWVIRNLVSDEVLDNDKLVEEITINLKNLKNYIENCKIQLKKQDKSKHEMGKIRRNIFQAQIVHKFSSFLGGKMVLFRKPSAFGRTYYHGLSIQNMSKEVRNAALGEHYQYDIIAAAYSDKIAMDNKIFADVMDVDLPAAIRLNDRNHPFTKMYLASRTEIRERLVRECIIHTKGPFSFKVKMIKRSINAMGFGARMDNPTKSRPIKTALEDIIKNKQDRELFLNHEFIVNFYKERKDLDLTIILDLKIGGAYEKIVENIKADKQTNRVSVNQILAFVYQHNETRYMDIMCRRLESYGIQVIARIHDCFIVKEKLSDYVLNDILSVMRSENKYADLDCEHIKPWLSEDEKQAYKDYDNELKAHKARIQEEEKRANYIAALAY